MNRLKLALAVALMALLAMPLAPNLAALQVAQASHPRPGALNAYGHGPAPHSIHPFTTTDDPFVLSGTGDKFTASQSSSTLLPGIYLTDGVNHTSVYGLYGAAVAGEADSVTAKTGDLYSSGHVHLTNAGSATLAAQSACGSTCSVSWNIGPSDVSGQINVTPGGSGITAGLQVKITFARSYTGPICLVAPQSGTPTDAAGNGEVVYGGAGSTQLLIGFATAPVSGRLYQIGFRCTDTV